MGASSFKYNSRFKARRSVVAGFAVINQQRKRSLESFAAAGVAQWRFLEVLGRILLRRFCGDAVLRAVKLRYRYR